MKHALKLHPQDNVAVCTQVVHPSDIVQAVAPDGSTQEVTAVSDIAFCNKIALIDLPKDTQVLKYGESIGITTADIACGALVNDTNIESQPRSYADEYITRSGEK